MGVIRADAGAGDLHPRMLAYTPGGPAEPFTQAVRDECERRGVASRVLRLDEIDPGPTFCYPVLVLVAGEPTTGGSAPRALDLVTRGVETYRRYRPSGLAAVRAGEVCATEAGVVHLVAPAELLTRLATSAVHSRICALHPLGLARPGDLFDVTGAPDPAPPERRLGERELERLWQVVRDQWKLPDDVGLVPQLLGEILACRRAVETPDKPAMYRPLGHTEAHRDKNRFDLILDPPHREEIGAKAWKSFQENGASIVREIVLPALQARFPTLQRPGGTTRNAQQQLRILVRNLELLRSHPGV